MRKNNIRMIVQGLSEAAQAFAERLEKNCYDLSVKYKLNTPPIVFLTSASDGRQTATLQFITNETKEPSYTEKEVDELLKIQRGNSYVAILTKTRDEELATIANQAPEPSGGKWRKGKK